MLVLGVDPGTRRLGWGLVRGEGNRAVHVAHGVLRACERLPLAERLLTLERGLLEVIERYAPSVGSVETLFFHKDAQAAAKLGHARGVVLLSLQREGVSIFEYQPARVKSMITGRGRAEKSQVAQMVKMLLNLASMPEEDAADALALALTHLRRAPTDERIAAGRLASVGEASGPARARRGGTNARRGRLSLVRADK